MIGMFLPAMMLRDYGAWGWVVFVIPNVLGAAALGYVLGNADKSKAMVARHGDMCLRFSQVTVAYHLFVIGWLYGRLLGWGFVGIVIIAAIAYGLLSRREWWGWGIVRAAVLLMMVSVVLGLVAAFLPGAWAGVWPGVFTDGSPTRLTRADLLWFIPSAIIGFALCPYLDLTFHRARQALCPRAGRAGFAIGFGVFFLLLMLFSLAYGGLLAPLISDSGQAELPWSWQIVLGVHLTLQAAFTIAVHGREIAARQKAGPMGGMLMVAGVCLVLGLLASTAPTAGAQELSGGEIAYRIFLLAYGLIFPAYVWLCVIPTWGNIPSRRKVIVWVAAVGIAFPMAYAGFIAGHSFWIAISLAVLAFARICLELSPPKDATIRVS